MKRESPDFTNFECDNCGACCRKLIVEAEHYDAKREPRLYEVSLNLTPDEITANRYSIVLWDSERRCCPMLTDENMCSIYATRPTCCLIVEAGDLKCQQARKQAGLEMLRDKDGLLPSTELLELSGEDYGTTPDEVL